MAKIIAVANQKGGVGKTTTSINLTASLAFTKNKTLLIDLDPQGNATMGSGVDKNQIAFGTNDVLLGEVSAEQAIVKTQASFDLMPGNNDLTVAEVNLLQQDEREQVLTRALEKCAMNYDYVIIDCPPSLNMLTLNALVAADSVLIPIQCEYYALEGLASLLKTIEQVKGSLNPSLSIEGILRTMYDPRNRLSDDVSKQLIEFFPSKVYRTVIPRNVRLAEAPSHGLPALLYDKRSQGAAAYLVLAGELVKRQSQAKTETQSNTEKTEKTENTENTDSAEKEVATEAVS